MDDLVRIAVSDAGGEAGFVCGSLSAFVSNFLFGQGPWTPWQMLAHAIIIQACDDYRGSYRKISRGTALRNEEWLISQALMFFGSTWYEELTDIDSGYLVRHLRMDVAQTAREDYRAAWRMVWQRGEARKRYEAMAIERFFKTDRFRRLSGIPGREVILEEKQKVVEEMLRRCRELSGKDNLAADAELGRIREFIRSEDFKGLSSLDPEKLIRTMEG